ncbi:MAG: TIGR04283 family arsenosugar biosynthesis glycosyltransferase [Leptolyngbyaceae cyanobacterium MO_188.B28]|nr:TIGR04283 family arsenosugar biosynthesis glycosyltransferase [Leptolyngbyaceae cyanobacterium MO_188.B28]
MDKSLIGEASPIQSRSNDKISIIIPVLNEVASVKATLSPLQWAANVELIVVDGGSVDGTPDLAASLGAQVIKAAVGRAHQMNVGAAAATGDILLFLHADTMLPQGFETMVRGLLRQTEVIAGAFALGINAELQGLRLIETMVNWRSRFLQTPYGDQAIFLTAPVFREMGGFQEMPLMEDFELVQRLKRRGKIAIAPAAVLTSGRRWEKIGVLKTTLINQFIVLAYYLGVSPTRLARWYAAAKGK